MIQEYNVWVCIKMTTESVCQRFICTLRFTVALFKSRCNAETPKGSMDSQIDGETYRYEHP